MDAAMTNGSVGIDGDFDLDVDTRLDRDARLTPGEKRILDGLVLDAAMSKRIDSYLTRRAFVGRRFGGEVSETSFRAWLRRVLGLDVKKERWS